MKTITLNLTSEQEELLIKKLNTKLFKLTEKEITYLRRDYKNPNEFTKRKIEEAKKTQEQIEYNSKLSQEILKQIKEGK
jgi:hypothetical protein|tara:strand:+ start:43 stop:279 length:237 start_codon:yes stop_codon:yes gene_type:complete